MHETCFNILMIFTCIIKKIEFLACVFTNNTPLLRHFSILSASFTKVITMKTEDYKK